jgi:hypothetical protein
MTLLKDKVKFQRYSNFKRGGALYSQYCQEIDYRRGWSLTEITTVSLSYAFQMVTITTRHIKSLVH